MIKLRTVYALSCALLLGNGLSHGALANDPSSDAEQTSADPCISREEAALKAKQTIQGEVLRVEGNTYVVKGKDGKEVSLQTDQTTEKINITQGDQILAYMNEQNHALWIGPGKSTDRRNEHEGDCKSN
jgi:hypothetical protein